MENESRNQSLKSEAGKNVGPVPSRGKYGNPPDSLPI